jgi:hypothetical protein
MTVTVLAVLFIVLMLVITVMGFKMIIKQGKSLQDINSERCSLCGQPFLKSQLIERQVRDQRLYYFCPSCITELYEQLTRTN